MSGFPFLPARQSFASVCAATALALAVSAAFPLRASAHEQVGAAPAAEHAKPSATAKDRGFSVFQRSILARVMPTSTAAPGEDGNTIRLAAAWDQREAAQVAVHAARDLERVEIRASELRDDKGHVLPASSIDLRMVRFYVLPLSVRTPKLVGVVPKTLEPAASLAIPAGTTRPWWITVHVPDGLPGGIYRGRITIGEASASAELGLEVDVLPRRLDEADTLLGPWSVPMLRDDPQPPDGSKDRLSDRADLVFRDIREHGMTSIALWSGSVSRTTKEGDLVLPDLDAALDLYARYRFPEPLIYSPVSLLSTNKFKSSENYKHYDPDVHRKLAAAIAREYTRHAAQARIPGIIFAPVEEPNFGDGVDRNDPPDSRQRIATELLKTMKGAGAATAMACTPDTARLGEGNLDYWIIAYKKFEAGTISRARAAGAHPGLYANSTLMGNGTFFSRFFFGYYPWATRLDAMMAWTYPSLPKRFPQNIGNKAEGPYRVIDGFLGSDGKPIPVIQWELAREGVDDFRYLVTLAHLVDRAKLSTSDEVGHAATEARSFLDGLRASVSPDAHRYAFEDPVSFEPMPAPGWDIAQFDATRKRSFELVKKLSALVDAKPSKTAKPARK